MRVLGIETSCDETAAAVATGPLSVASSIIARQAEQHARFGGVVPEIAARRHVETITAVIETALEQAGLGLDAIEGIAVTHRPGLIGSLLIGVTAAKALALARDIPLVGVHHLEGHIFSAWLTAGRVRAPAVALIASGGHTELFHVHAAHRYSLLGTRRDDAAGEALDKGARLLGLGAGGGAALERLASEATEPAPRLFGRVRTQQPLDFSFSGLKTALARFLEQDAGRTPRSAVAAAYQAAIVEHLCDRTRAALEFTAARCLLLGGGVAGNGLLRRALEGICGEMGVELLLPLPEYCTDNAAMIAAAGCSRLTRGERDGLDLVCAARAPLCDQSGPASR